MRAGELAGLRLDEVDLARGVVLVHGKGNKIRLLALGRKACRDLDRYGRARRSHRDAELPNLWLGHAGPMTTNGIFQTVRKRCKQAGVNGVHPHSFRHLFAASWLAEGGGETDLMLLAGWSTRDMLSRYGRATAAERARQAPERCTSRVAGPDLGPERRRQLRDGHKVTLARRRRGREQYRDANTRDSSRCRWLHSL